MKQFIQLRVDGFWQDYAIEVQLEGIKSFTEVQLPWFTNTATLFEEAA
jgi:hypothetical protein